MRSRRPLILVLLLTLVVPAAITAQQNRTTVTRDRILEAAGVKEGATVCEVGAGDGSLSIAAARIVGATGRVYANELGEQHVRSLRDKIAASGLSQVTVVAGDVTKTNFPDGACDALFMNDVYHHFSDPAAMNRSIAQALKPGARVAIMDFTPPGKEAPTAAERGNDGMHGIHPETLTREMKEAGFEPVSSETGWRSFLAVFVKSDGSSVRHDSR